MDREQAIAILRAHEREFRISGVAGVSLFGSVARGEGSANDVDVAVRLGKGFAKPGLDYFGRMEALESRLSEILGCEVDVVEEPTKKPRLQRNIERDRTIAF